MTCLTLFLFELKLNKRIDLIFVFLIMFFNFQIISSAFKNGIYSFFFNSTLRLLNFLSELNLYFVCKTMCANDYLCTFK